MFLSAIEGADAVNVVERLVLESWSRGTQHVEAILSVLQFVFGGLRVPHNTGVIFTRDLFKVMFWVLYGLDIPKKIIEN